MESDTIITTILTLMTTENTVRAVVEESVSLDVTLINGKNIDVIALVVVV